MTIYSDAVTHEQSQMIRGNKFRLTKVVSYNTAQSSTQHNTTSLVSANLYRKTIEVAHFKILPFTQNTSYFKMRKNF